MRKPPLPPMEEPKEAAMGLELRLLNNLSMRLFEKRSNKDKVDDATGSNAWILRFLDQCEKEGKKVYQKDIEKKFCITRSTVSKVLSLMEQKDLIERKNVRGDARLKEIIMTQKAREIRALMIEDGQMFENILRKGLSEEEIRTFYAVTAKIKENLKEALE